MIDELVQFLGFSWKKLENKNKIINSGTREGGC